MDEHNRSAAVPYGQYKGEPWSTVPREYLSWMANNRKGPFAEDCRRELVRRRGGYAPGAYMPRKSV